jgi:hypothetical protein
MGDSTLDNRHTIGEAQDVRAQLRLWLAPKGHVTRLATHKSHLHDIVTQIGHLPPGATHLVVSIGSGDLVDQLGLAKGEVAKEPTLDRLTTLAASFGRDYGQMLDALLARRLPTIPCTIPQPRFPNPATQRIAVAGAAMYNDAIIRQAVRVRVPVIDLRLICTEPEDYADALEPSAQGGAKIADTIAGVVREHDFSRRTTAIYL